MTITTVDDGYPACDICGDPSDYCQGHGEIAAERSGASIWRDADGVWARLVDGELIGPYDSAAELHADMESL
jgi:hypothetical protein